MEISGKTALITGGAGGIGFSTAKLLGEYGVTVVLTDILEDQGRDAAKELEDLGIETAFIPSDLTDQDSIDALFSSVIERFGCLDILVNSAGVTSLTPIPEISEEEWNRVLSINLGSVFFCSQRALKSMRKQKSGKIINIASNAGRVGGVAVGAHYSSSKAGIICLTKTFALYGAPFGITANCVAPGPIDTPMTECWDETTSKTLIERIPLHRFGKPEEVGEAICFLASDKASFITGATLDVNGGIVMC